MADISIHIPSVKYLNSLDNLDKNFPAFEDIESRAEKFMYCPELWVKGMFSKIKNLGTVNRLYFGSEFCQRLIPDLDQVKQAMIAAKERKLKFTLLTPYVTAEGVEKLEPLFQYLNSIGNKEIEIVVNDPATIDMAVEYKNITPVLGRVKDPMKRMARFARQMPQLNATQQEALRSSDITIDLYQKFLLDMGISRIEMDLVPQGIGIDFNILPIRASFYYPWTYITTGRICEMGSLNQEDKEKFTVYNKCRKECQTYYSSWTTEWPGVSNKIFAFGNTVFMLCEVSKSALKKYVEQGFDRIVYQPVIPV